jgi:hypothetical protein
MRDMAAPVEGVGEAVAEPEPEALVARPVLVEVPVAVPVEVVEVPVTVVRPVAVREWSVDCLLVENPVIGFPVWDPVGPREEVPVVEASVEDPVEDPVEVPEAEEEETVEDVPVVEAVELEAVELEADSVTLKSGD